MSFVPVSPEQVNCFEVILRQTKFWKMSHQALFSCDLLPSQVGPLSPLSGCLVLCVSVSNKTVSKLLLRQYGTEIELEGIRYASMVCSENSYL